MTFSTEDTIVAVATPPGIGGVSIVRLSGPAALAISQLIFRSSHAAKRVFAPRHLYFGAFIDPIGGQQLDEGLLAYMPGPTSYTGEDVVEWQAHGSPLIVQHLVDAALRAGARAAEAGEMTLRAFLHGRLDLAQAEAVADLIAANSDAALRQALGQLAGQLSERVAAARSAILRALTPIEATIDFPEEEVPSPERTMLASAIAEADAHVRDLLAGAERGRVARDGLCCVLIGRPNVGKSRLLNTLLRRDRAIVTPIAGTTRDTIEETVLIGGIACTLIDTAGIIPTDDPIERLGIARSREALARADLVLLICDRSVALTAADRAVIAELGDQQRQSDGEKAIVPAALILVNKADLPTRLDMAELAAAIAPVSVAAAPLTISSATGEGIAALEAVIATVAGAGADTGSAPLVARARHRAALRQTAATLSQAAQGLAASLPLDLVATDLHEALYALGTITGESITEDLLSSIFSEFCIGK